ncbi:MAG: PKD domain-containing protein, partial [Dolichospermum sp.]
NTPTVTNGVSGTGVFSSFKNASTAAGLYDPSLAGFGTDTIYYKYTTGIDCYDSVKLPINIAAKARTVIAINPNSNCLPSNGKVDFSSAATVNGSTIASYGWNFKNPSSAIADTAFTANASYFYTTGAFDIRHTIVTANGCVFDTTFNKSFVLKPSFGSFVIPDVCENNLPFVLSAPSITNGAVGTGVFRSFKNAISTMGVYNPTTAGYGIDTVYYIFTTSSGCLDSTKAQINVKARPRAGFVINPPGCLNAAGTASFTSNVSVPNSIISGYSWQFESPLGTPSTTSVVPNPTYNYASDGTYTIKLTILAANGCVFDTSETRGISKQPAINPIVVPSGVCENGVTQTISAPSITNGAIGNGSFRSLKNAISSTGIYDPSIAGYGVDTIYYTFITGGGCRDSVKSPITIQARPRATFTVSPLGCLDVAGTANFTSSVSVPNSSVNTYLWQFESPLNTPSTTSNLANPIYNYIHGANHT